MNEIEHHWHKPTQGQVVKAMYQFLTDIGITQEKLIEILDKKVKEAVEGSVDIWVNSGKFDALIVHAVSTMVQNEKKAYDQNSYGYNQHIRDLVQRELANLVLKEYKVSVEKR